MAERTWQKDVIQINSIIVKTRSQHGGKNLAKGCHSENSIIVKTRSQHGGNNLNQMQRHNTKTQNDTRSRYESPPYNQ